MLGWFQHLGIHLSRDNFSKDVIPVNVLKVPLITFESSVDLIKISSSDEAKNSKSWNWKGKKVSNGAVKEVCRFC